MASVSKPRPAGASGGERKYEFIPPSKGIASKISSNVAPSQDPATTSSTTAALALNLPSSSAPKCAGNYQTPTSSSSSQHVPKSPSGENVRTGSVKHAWGEDLSEGPGTTQENSTGRRHGQASSGKPSGRGSSDSKSLNRRSNSGHSSNKNMK
mmetsp:Transcript_5178/g.5982  ORF Transcript_5178/g.5982 Transcript_5178/m.5982 type:complete len:153 (+) Transcript_5178:107-565(+)|eukprot:CAMPEP_0197854464 /NCGR_PEP_ID=MMETSP1438-20131217/24730_1 /TAXON_ID=1461541 /ORGANISM="Pterosperma sp., Strain CCMP1384" /LENGTH=152 /DNA_ID=CAMNT_0043469219 /DNA_START=99 /DNA_END=557 /DNA_ORIENTATION=-